MNESNESSTNISVQSEIPPIRTINMHYFTTKTYQTSPDIEQWKSFLRLSGEDETPALRWIQSLVIKRVGIDDPSLAHRSDRMDLTRLIDLLNWRKMDGETILHQMAFRNWSRILQYFSSLVADFASSSSLHLHHSSSDVGVSSSDVGESPLTQALIDCNARRLSDGWEPIHVAACRASWKFARLLLEAFPFNQNRYSTLIMSSSGKRPLAFAPPTAEKLCTLFKSAMQLQLRAFLSDSEELSSLLFSPLSVDPPAQTDRPLPAPWQPFPSVASSTTPPSILTAPHLMPWRWIHLLKHYFDIEHRLAILNAAGRLHTQIRLAHHAPSAFHWFDHALHAAPAFAMLRQTDWPFYSPTLRAVSMGIAFSHRLPDYTPSHGMVLCCCLAAGASASLSIDDSASALIASLQPNHWLFMPARLAPQLRVDGAVFLYVLFEPTPPLLRDAQGEQSTVADSLGRFPTEAIPPEVLLHIFSCLSARDLARCAMVCRKFRDVSGANSLWQRLILEDFPAQSPAQSSGSVSAKLLYLSLYHPVRLQLPLLPLPSPELVKGCQDRMVRTTEWRLPNVSVFLTSSLCSLPQSFRAAYYHHILPTETVTFPLSIQKRVVVDGQVTLLELRDLQSDGNRTAKLLAGLYATAAIVLYSCHDRPSFLDVPNQIQRLYELLPMKYLPIVLVGVVSSHQDRMVTRKDGQDCAYRFQLSGCFEVDLNSVLSAPLDQVIQCTLRALWGYHAYLLTSIGVNVGQIPLEYSNLLPSSLSMYFDEPLQEKKCTIC